MPITVYALRKDGFSGDISLSVKGGPPGLILNGGIIPGGQDKVRATLTFPANFPRQGPRIIAIEGHAIIQGHDVVRAALPADDMIQAFMYHHLVSGKANDRDGYRHHGAADAPSD